MQHFLKTMATGAVALVTLTACGGSEPADPNAGTQILPNGMTVRAQIEARQDGYKAIGANFKTIRDELQSGSADITAVQTAAAALPEVSAGMADWFPVGTGPDSGVETEALPVIWDESEDFATKVSDYETAIAALNVAAEAGDVEAISSAVQAVGGTCGACHDKFRLDD
ncbi:MAG: cytochrome c [Henriciella sp.]|nr:cytochrome c [Henriciella sp.]